VCVLFKIQSKLEEALNLATEFQNSLQEFINWLTLAEQSLNIASSPSLILNTVLSQIEEHKVTMTYLLKGFMERSAPLPYFKLKKNKIVPSGLC
jgi:hypothetical protein